MAYTMSINENGTPTIDGVAGEPTGTSGNITTFKFAEFDIKLSNATNGNIQMTFANPKTDKPIFIELEPEGLNAYNNHGLKQDVKINLAVYSPDTNFNLIFSPQASLNMPKGNLVNRDICLQVANVVIDAKSNLNVGLQTDEGMSPLYISESFRKAQKENPYNPAAAQAVAEERLRFVISTADLNKDIAAAGKSFKGGEHAAIIPQKLASNDAAIGRLH